MSHSISNYHIYPLGDSAATIEFDNRIDEEINKHVLNLFNHLKADPVTGMIEAVPAYSTLTIYYDLLLLRDKISTGKSAFSFVRDELSFKISQLKENRDADSRTVEVPVCYDPELAPDLLGFTQLQSLSIDTLVKLHSSKTYRVFMLGFVPGFAYMGELDERLHLPRKHQPVPVSAGSVGIAGRQTGIYPLQSPGGWHIIGRTPLKLFDPSRQEPTLLRAGDHVQFKPISRNEFESY